MKIVLLEDDSFIAEEIKLYFEIKNHQVDIYTNGQDLLNDLQTNIDIYLLDINTPVKNGIDTLKELRHLGIKTPAIFLTSMSDIDYVKLGYDAGCSDYIRKPFHFEELELRISKILFDNQDKTIKIGPKQFFNLNTNELTDNDKLIDLNTNEKNLLFLLVRNINHTIHTQTIMDYIWQDKIVNDNTLRTQIKKLRAKISYDFIKNIRGSGYKIEKYD